MTRKTPPILGLQPQSTTSDNTHLTFTIPLQLITPMVGGGTQSKTINPITPIRASAIRGNLRFWWRALQHNSTNAEQLYTKEYRIWGGEEQKPTGSSDMPDAESKVKTHKSIVSLRIIGNERLDFSFFSAGVHQYQHHSNRHSSMVRLKRPDLPPSATYALFPLQLDRAHLSQLPPRDAQLPELAAAGTFKLRVNIDLQRISLAKEETEGNELKRQCEVVSEISKSIKTWLLFGGLGSRTRRGFGHLDIREKIEVERCPVAYSDSVKQTILDILADQSDIRSSIAKATDINTSANVPPGMNEVDPPNWPVIGATPDYLIGSPESSATKALNQLLEAAQTLSQGVGTGRNPGQRNRPGQSRWSEGDSLKLSLDKSLGKVTTFDHPVRKGFTLQLLAAPRAARGLPLQIKFLGSKRDSLADAELLPTQGDRLPSPIIFSVVKHNNQYLPMVLRLNIPPSAIEKVKINFLHKDNKNVVAKCLLPVATASDIESPNGYIICAKDENYADAFFRYLREQRSFK